MTRFLFCTLFVSISSFFCKVHGQTIPVGSVMETPLRSLQLAGKVNSAISFCVRPISSSSPIFDTIAGFADSGQQTSYGRSFSYLKGKGKFVLLPVTLTQQINTHHPYGWNDGAMIPANGYQALATAGFYSSLGPLEIQLQPEFVYAANTPYPTNPQYGSTNNKSYQKIFGGQSDIRLSAFSLSVGASTANMWWGPGKHSSLLMSNNAPGFLHGYFRTQKPIHTAIGSFEWELIGGGLHSDSNLAYENKHLQPLTVPAKSRYLSAFVISYQPKWMPGMFLGMTRALQRYQSDIESSDGSFLDKYIPVLFKPVTKQNAQGDDTLRTDQLASFFLRWVFYKAKAEFYIEYGYNDYGVNVRDYLMGPSHSAAYLVGIRKVFPRTKQKSIEFGLELTQMSQTPDWLVRDAGNWYVHGEIAEGYTNQNQIIGTGAGFGANVLTLDMAWVNGLKRLGFILERINRDPQHHSTKWVDIGLGVSPQLDYKQFLFSGKFELVKSKDYMWQSANTVYNFHCRLAVQYNF